jgi:2-polyprenyl-6-methoxyphenol hydroxylase-like FAD-dependent oxidoreductase
MHRETDVVIAGGSIAGCALAALLGRQGIRATVLEKTAKADHYKVVCTHFIQPGATPVIRRLGLAEPMERAGAVRNGLEVWSDAGWYHTPDGAPYGYSLRRAKLDPMLRELAAGTPNVEVLRGLTVDAVLRDDAGRPAGLRARTTAGDEVEVRARVVVGADGRGATVARLAGVPGRVLPHNRFGYMAYFTDLPLENEHDRSLFWFADGGRDVLYAFPNDDGVTALAMFLHKDRLPAFKADKEAEFVRAYDGLSRRPPLEEATRISPLIGKIDVPNVRRPAARPGLAFVGDAAQASDPLWGVGCGFAFQSAEWLADEIAGPLLADGDVDAGLRRYARRHRKVLLGHHLMMSDFADGRRMNPIERMIHRAAVRDPKTARLTHDIGARDRPVTQVMRPARLARAAVMAART